MAFVLGDKVRQTTETGGTGTLSLEPTVPTGFRSFVAGVGDGNTTLYCIDEGTAGGDFEIGLGTVTDSATDTLTRDTVIISSTGTSKISWPFSGVRNVFCTFPADMIASFLDPTVSAGMVCRTSSSLTSFAHTNRSIVGSGGLDVTNGNGVSGNPTVHPAAWSAIQTSDFSAAVGNRYRVDGFVKITLPTAGLSDGDSFELWDCRGTWGSNSPYLDYVSTTIMGVASDYRLNLPNAKVTVCYLSADSDWRIF